MSSRHDAEPFISRTIHRLSVAVLLLWLALIALLNIAVPQLEAVAQAHAVSLSPNDAPSMQAMKRIGHVFQAFDSDSALMIVLEGDTPLGEDAHQYYDDLIHKLSQDTKHVEHIQDFWGNLLTAPGAQSDDGKAAYVQVYLHGNIGESLSNESVASVRDIVAHTPPPGGVKTYITGPAVLSADMIHSGDKGLVLVMAVTVAVITLMLLVVFRSIVTVFLILVIVGIELAAARGMVAFLGYHGMLGLSTFAVNILTLLAIAAGTDYAIFLIGRYQEARQAGEDREAAYFTTFRGTAHVILASGLTIAGATYCLTFTRLPYFQTMGVPCAVGMIVAVVAALTLGPAMIAVCSRFGLFEPKRKITSRGWRRVGTAVVRWPIPILAASCALALVGLVALPAYKANFDDRSYLPADIPANIGYAAADRHFSPARLTPEVLMIETDHDMRNPADMLVIDRVSKGVFHVPGIAFVQSITRPLGTPIEHTSIPFQISMQGTVMTQNMGFMRGRMADMLKMGDEMGRMIDTMKRMVAVVHGMVDTTHDLVAATKQLTDDTTEIRDHVADFDDFFRPLRSYFYWERHCYSIPFCFAVRSAFDAIDGIDLLDDDLISLTKDLSNLDALMPQLLTFLPPMIASMENMRTMMLSMHSTFSGLMNQMDALQKNSSAMGQAFDAAKNDDSFYLPPEAFDNPSFKRGLEMFLSPDGKAVRFVITHEGDPATLEGMSHVDPIKAAAREAIKGTPMARGKISLAGTAATYKDMRDGSNYDLLIAGIAALCLIFVIMLIITRSVIAAVVIVGTVVLSLCASFGLSVLVWQHILGIELHWMVLAMSVILLLAVGSDYNLLLVSRFKQEIGAGLKTGIIRAMAGTGAVVTAAGLVFAFTMSAFVVSDLRVLGQVGTTIGMGLLFDTLVVRAFMTPSIAALLGRWFWWPQIVRTRPARAASPTVSTPPNSISLSRL
jgi:putative drug exporter of the RND superfamily